MILNILNDSIRYTFSNPKTFIKIILCEIFSAFIIPFLIICGFQYKIIEDSLENIIFEDSKLSELTGIKKLLKDGVKVFFVKFTYLIIPTVLSFAIVLGLIPKLTCSVINIIIFVVLYIYCYIAIANMVYYNSFKKAFAITEISVVKNNIGLLILLGLIVSVLFIFYAITTLLDNSILFLGQFIDINTLIFPSFPLHNLLFLIIANLTIQPFIDILTARIIGIIYENRSET